MRALDVIPAFALLIFQVMVDEYHLAVWFKSLTASLSSPYILRSKVASDFSVVALAQLHTQHAIPHTHAHK